jgi:CRISPR-associated protein Csm3
MSEQIKLLGFVKIKGEIEALSGLHIGGTSDSIDKGGIDTPVIKNPVTNEPYIPGSSLRGRMRALLEIKTGAKLTEMSKGIRLEIYKKEESDAYQKALRSHVCRVFGNSASDPGLPSVLIVRDALLSSKSRGEYMKDGLPVTEAKIEIVVDRITAQAMPRTIERVPAGAFFDFETVYKVQTYENGRYEKFSDDPETKSENKVQEDLENLVCALEIIQDHAGLGGNTSRGHGYVKFHISALEQTRITDGKLTNIPLLEKRDQPYALDACAAAIKTVSFFEQQPDISEGQ